MTSEYQYTQSPIYIDSLVFDYIEVFSFQRGTEFEQVIKLLYPEYKELKEQKSSTQRFLELDKIFGYTQYLVDKDKHFHFSAVKTSSFQKHDEAIKELIHILYMPVNDVPAWVCAPVYRDAIVFYDKAGSIISTLNVCLGCKYMETSPKKHISADAETYKLLKAWFKAASNDVEGDI